MVFLVLPIITIIYLFNSPDGGYNELDLIERKPHLGFRYEKNSDILFNRIQKIGAKEAHEELVKKVEGYDRERAHNFGHVFGEALYRAKGASGISICDTRMYNGCIHEFIVNAIQNSGPEIVKELGVYCDQAAREASVEGEEHSLNILFTCQHGIGHGLIYYYGYTQNSLKKSLDICRTIPSNDVFYGCDGGVYMEYNVRTLLPDETFKPIGDDWADPCNILENKFLEGCFHWLPQAWWGAPDVLSKLEEGGITKLFIEMGDWCETLDGRIRAACLAGVAKQIPVSAEYDANLVHDICSSMSDASSVFICKTFAANNITEVTGPDKIGSFDIERDGKRVDGAPICNGLKGEELSYCIDNVFEGNSRTMLMFENTPLDNYSWFK